ncbi:MAG: homocysteine S-methyltransferase family protein [Opitutaceae bacterium]|jgi:5-methyltetrahydrofolate--homocysteine methyltransferase
MTSSTTPAVPSLVALDELCRSRIAVIDGAMGSLIQTYKLQEVDYRGARFNFHPHDLKGNNDILNLTRPDLIEDIHRQYFEAGADITKTNSFNATTISQADYQTGPAVVDINLAAARLASSAARKAEAASPGRRCFVAGSIGPLNRMLSMSPDVDRPEYRAVTWQQVVDAYAEQVRALIQGGADVLLIETIFDTLNAKAALFAIGQVFDELGLRLPVMVSMTITDASGRTLSGQTLSAFYTSIRHARPFSVGINCSLGARQMRPYIEEFSSVADCRISCHPNAGLPNAFGGYDETPDQMAATLAEFASSGLVNIVGGCCGSTPKHIRAIAQAVKGLQPRAIPERASSLRLSGLESLQLA